MVKIPTRPQIYIHNIHVHVHLEHLSQLIDYLFGFYEDSQYHSHDV